MSSVAVPVCTPLSRWMGLFAITACGWFFVPFESSVGDLATWIWQGLWAPAAGALAGGLLGCRWAASVPLWWGLAAALGSHGAPNCPAGSAAVAALYFLGLSSALLVGGNWSLAGAWLFLGACLSALPSAGGIWAMAPGADWLSTALNLSPVVWVCESAGLDWMRHISVYEVAGAGDLGPQERMAWVAGPGLLAVLVLTMALAALAGYRSRAPRIAKTPTRELGAD